MGLKIIFDSVNVENIYRSDIHRLDKYVINLKGVIIKEIERDFENEFGINELVNFLKRFVKFKPEKLEIDNVYIHVGRGNDRVKVDTFNGRIEIITEEIEYELRLPPFSKHEVTQEFDKICEIFTKNHRIEFEIINVKIKSNLGKIIQEILNKLELHSYQEFKIKNIGNFLKVYEKVDDKWCLKLDTEVMMKFEEDDIKEVEKVVDEEYGKVVEQVKSILSMLNLTFNEKLSTVTLIELDNYLDDKVVRIKFDGVVRGEYNIVINKLSEEISDKIKEMSLETRKILNNVYELRRRIPYQLQKYIEKKLPIEIKL